MTEPTDIPEQLSPRSEARRRRQSARAIAAERGKKQARVKVVSVAAVSIIVIAFVAGLLYQRQQRTVSIPIGTQSYSVASGQHTTSPVTYAQQPPVGGEHHPRWQNCGAYGAPVSNEAAVHSLEHGAVWITYQPDLPEAQVATLRKRAEKQSFILVSPMHDIPSPVVASAWGRQIELDAADDERLDQFIRSFRLSAEAPEPGASCAGGNAETV